MKIGFDQNISMVVRIRVVVRAIFFIGLMVCHSFHICWSMGLLEWMGILFSACIWGIV